MTTHNEHQASDLQGRPKPPPQILGGMSDLVIPCDGPDVIHLPECDSAFTDLHTANCVCRCICPELHACEQRVRDEERALIAVERTTLAELNAEWHKGVQAARDAVAAADPYWKVDDGETGDVFVMQVDDALAAIDALRSTNTDTRITSTNEDT